MRLKVSMVTPGKVRLFDITVPAIFEPHTWHVNSRSTATGVAALEVVDEPADLPQCRVNKFSWFAAGPARQQARPTRGEDKSTGHQKRCSRYSRRNHTDHT